MLKQESIQAIAKALKLKPQDLEEKIKSESEEDITLPELNVFTSEELETRLKNEKTSSYNDGKTAGVEMLVKDKKKELGYDFEGKDFDSLLNYHTEKIKTSNGKPDERVKELEKDIERLNKTHQEKLNQTTQELTKFKSDYNNQLQNNKLLASLPKETTIPGDDIITLFRANYQTEVSEDGKTVVKKNGETVKDPTTASPLELNDVFTNFISERNFAKRTPGRGGDNEFGDGGSAPKSISKFNEKWSKENPGKTMNGTEYQEAYSKFREENKEVTE